MSGAPWQLFLPSDRSSPVLLLGRVSSEIAPALEGRCVETSESAGPFGAIVRLPGGPGREAPTVARLSALLRPGGHLVWISDRLRFDRGSEDPGADEPSTRLLSFRASGSALWSPESGGAQELRGTGKRDLVRGLLRSVLPFRESGQHWVCVSMPGEESRGGWICELLEDLKTRGITDLQPERLARIDRTGSGRAVAQAMTGAGEPLILKVALEPRAAEDLAAEERCIEALRGRADLTPTVVRALPRGLAAGSFHGTRYRLEARLPGRPASELMYRLADRAKAVESAVRWIAELHRSTRGPEREAGEVADWVREVLLRLCARAGCEDGGFGNRIASYLEAGLDRDPVPSVFGHGDFWLGNLMRDPSSGAITGVIDWDFADAQAPPLEDVLHLLGHRKWLFSGWDPGGQLAALIRGRYSRRDRQMIAGYMRDLDLAPRVLAPLAILHWARYLATREPVLASRRGWYVRSYTRVRKVLEPRIGPELDGLGSRICRA